MADYWSRTLSRRLSRRTVLASTGAAALGAAFLAACGGSSDSGKASKGPKDASGLLSQPVDTTKTAKKGGVLKRNGAGDGSLDPNQSVGQTSPYLENVYMRLITWKPGFMAPAQEDQIVGDTAESWEWSPDRTQITMKLRQGVKFHNLPPVNGRVMDTDDVLFSWKRFAETSATRGAIANAANPSAPVLSVTAPDTKTIVIKLKDPIAYALSLFGAREQVNMLPKEAANTAVLDLKGQHLGSGPLFLSKYEPSVGFTFKKHPDFWDKDNVYPDQVDYPNVTDYAQGLAQFRTGNIYMLGNGNVVGSGGPSVKQDDVLQLKKDVPAINLYAGDLTQSITRMVFGKRTQALRDERVRLAFQMSYDRETWIDTILNASKFEAVGLPIERSWFSAFPGMGHSFDGWRLDPRDEKTFGANAKYYKYDIAEAKKLLTAAGFANGLEVNSTYYTTSADINQIQARQGMNSDAGIKFKNSVLDYQTEFIPKFRDVQGDFDGVIYRGTIVVSPDSVDRMSSLYWSKSGAAFLGYDAGGKGDGSGDPYIDDTIIKMQRETDVNKAKAMMLDLERYLAPKAYANMGIAAATTFTMAWPVIGNFRVWQGAYHTNVRTSNTRWWIDDTKAPLKSS